MEEAEDFLEVALGWGDIILPSLFILLPGMWV